MEEPVVSAYHTYRKAEQCENLTQKINLYLQAAKDFLLAAEHLQSSKTSTEVLHNTTNNYSNSNRTSNSDNKSNNCNTNHRNSVSSDDHVERSLVYLSVTATQKAIKYQIMNKKRTNTNTTSKIDEFWKLFLKSNDLSGTLYEGKYNFHKNRKGLQELEKVLLRLLL